MRSWGNAQILQCVSFLQHHSSSCVECVYGNRLCIYFNLYNQSPWLKSSRGNIWIFPNNSWCKKNSEETAELQPQYEVQNASYLLEPFADSYSVIKTGICASMCSPPPNKLWNKYLQRRKRKTFKISFNSYFGGTKTTITTLWTTPQKEYYFVESRIQSNNLTIQTSVKTKESKIKVTTGLGKTFQTTIRFRLVLDYRWPENYSITPAR